MITLRLSTRSSHLKDAGYSITEQSVIYLSQLVDIQENPREYLDSLEYLSDYKVSWKDYRYTAPTMPWSGKNRNPFK